MEYRQPYAQWRSEVRRSLAVVDESLGQLRSSLTSAVATSDSFVVSISSAQAGSAGALGQPGVSTIHDGLRSSSRRLDAIFYEVQVLLSPQYLNLLASQKFSVEHIQSVLSQTDLGIRITTASVETYLSSSEPCGTGSTELRLLNDQLGAKISLTSDDDRQIHILVVYDILATSEGLMLTSVRMAQPCSNDDLDPAMWDLIFPYVQRELSKPKLIPFPLGIKLTPDAPMTVIGERIDGALSLFGISNFARHPFINPLSSVIQGFDSAVSIFPVLLRTAVVQGLSLATGRMSSPYNLYQFTLSSGPTFSAADQAIDFRVGLYVHVEGTVELKVTHVDWGVELWGSMPVRCRPVLSSDGSALTLICSQNGKIDIDRWDLHPDIAKAVAAVVDALTGALQRVKDRVNEIDLGEIARQDVPLDGVSGGSCRIDSDRVILYLKMK